jgi:hypothetical protein
MKGLRRAGGGSSDWLLVIGYWKRSFASLRMTRKMDEILHCVQDDKKINI